MILSLTNFLEMIQNSGIKWFPDFQEYHFQKFWLKQKIARRLDLTLSKSTP